VTLDAVSPSQRWKAIDRAAVPAYHWASWFDGGTAEGVLERFARYRSPLRIVIGAWTHGGGLDANPYRANNISGLSEPGPVAQLKMIRQYLDPLMRAEPPARADPVSEIRYFTLGTNEWRTTRAWPPTGVRQQRWYLHEGGYFHAGAELPADGFDSYDVDFSASTGTQNRWHTQLGTPVNYDAIGATDHRRLIYASAPLSQAMEMTGTPLIDIWIATSAPDGAVFVYLEDQAPDGGITYLTEGQLRLIFPADLESTTEQCVRKTTDNFTRTSARPPVPGAWRRYCFKLNPISVVLAPRHRLRLAIAGADADSFERLPANGAAPRLGIGRDRSRPSFVVLPVRN
jgi:putative CocE/NonD family hydrolase